MNQQKWLKYFSFASMYGMFLILVMGALVTKTESGRGCGDDWPLCNGKFVPAYTIESIIEYSHRFVVGVVGIVLLIATILVFVWCKRKDAKIFVSGAMFFTILQAVLGALAVIWPQSSSVLALHFGFSLMAFAFTLLLSLVFTRFGSMLSGSTVSITAGLRWGIFLITIYSYAVVYLGAFVRHTQSSGGCIGWPLCNGSIIPDMIGPTRIVFAHRMGAAALFILLLWLFLAIRSQTRSQDNIYQSAKWALILVILQIFSGAFVTLSIGYDVYLIASLLHAVLVSALFGILCYLCVLAFLAKKQNGQAYKAR
ncbi:MULTISPECIES: heme A synthase [Paenibacillus]|uniref:COX15/CtaA family protein n=1 Tax=Paenibacillus baimaensis TaxID=2982185 RepID=A0ABT2UQ67_9BACL|nr:MULTISPECIES: COX15/CtaA family protein [unclassified Paenibacillus]MCU6796784.1 COX15/CtaA family protein [Paenibacillus sp. WQ 127069]OMF14951.1 heme A synthase [Paenibacillus sp. FSL H7-0331]